ncbi:MAG: hypothetical protein JW974_02490 [Alphaproteobacteria bacterium]|nr:hypothetical protein [Alphaproteobacteria bacterium]MBN2675165.1 hypothetical protein [Alphaproteobacteria bacterium]
MNKLLSFLIILLVGTSAFAAETSTDRRSMATQWGSAPRATVSKNQISATATVRAGTTATDTAAAIATIEKKKQDCINNNIGAGNTFVWASKYSDVSNYSSMIEDTETPENNVCFVRVDLKSSDSKISVYDIDPVYYEMGQSIVCGSWADSGKIRNRILDAKKSNRTWGTVAGAVGGAGIGVGAMELFGNKLIGGDVQGQKGLNQNELIRSQLLVLKEKDTAQYNKFKTYLQDLKKECESDIWTEADAPEKPTECDLNYDVLLTI